MSHSDNAIMAKVHALYGKRLKAEDYDTLLNMKTVGEVAAYLKSDTYYEQTLQELREDLIHRGQLETMVRRRILNIYIGLIKYSTRETLFLQAYIMHNEILQLLLALRLLNTNSMEKYIVSLPVYLTRYMSFDMFRLASARSFDDLLKIVAHSEYYNVLKNFRPITSDTQIDMSGCETALLTCYYSTMFRHIKEEYRGETRENLLFHFKTRLDLHNLMVIYRLKRYFNYSPEQIRRNLVTLDSLLSRRSYEALLETQDVSQLLQKIGSLPLMRHAKLNTLDDNAHILARLAFITHGMSLHYFRLSQHPAVVVMNYMTLLEIEVNNLVRIIEGIRYKLPAEEIRSLLVI